MTAVTACRRCGTEPLGNARRRRAQADRGGGHPAGRVPRDGGAPGLGPLGTLTCAPAPAGVQQFPQHPGRWVRKSGHDPLVLTLLDLTRRAPAKCVHDLQGLDKPPPPRGTSTNHFGGGLVSNLLQTAALEQRWQLPPEHRIVAARNPPVTVPPRVVVDLITRMRGID